MFPALILTTTTFSVPFSHLPQRVPSYFVRLRSNRIKRSLNFINVAMVTEARGYFMR